MKEFFLRINIPKWFLVFYNTYTHHISINISKILFRQSKNSTYVQFKSSRVGTVFKFLVISVPFEPLLFFPFIWPSIIEHGILYIWTKLLYLTCPPWCNFGPKLKPHVGRSAKKNWQQFRPYIKKSMSRVTYVSWWGLNEGNIILFLTFSACF